MVEPAGEPLSPPPSSDAALHKLQQTLEAAETGEVQKPFRVEVQQPEAWFDTFKQVQEGELPRRGFTVGKVEFNDGLLANLRCSVRVMGQEKDPEIIYNLEGRMNYSPKRLEKDGGFHPVGVVVKIAKRLREQGVNVKFKTLENGQQLMFIDKDGQNCVINLGWASKEEMPEPEPEDYDSTSKRFKEMYGPPGRKSSRVRSTDSETNESVYISLTPNQEDSHISVNHSEDLTKQVTTFSGIVELFTQAYYQAHDLKPSTTGLTMGIPDWETYTSDDRDLLARPPAYTEYFALAFRKATEIGTFTSSEEKAAMPTFADIGGQPKAVEEARRLVMAIQHADDFAKRGVDRPKGILFKGPPGTGKTMLAMAIARKAGTEFISLSMADLANPFYGVSDQQTQEFFTRARALTSQGKDVIVFMDEVDSLMRARGGSHEATQRIVNIILQNLSGLKDNPRLTIIAATNNRDFVDEAFLRAGRIDKEVALDYPDETGRADILRTYIKKRLEKASDPTTLLIPNFDFVLAAKGLGQISPAEIANLVNLAFEEKTVADIRFQAGNDGGKPWSPLTVEDLLQTKERYKRTEQSEKPVGFQPAPKIAA